LKCTVEPRNERPFSSALEGADLTGADRVDLCFCDGQGVEADEVAGFPFHPKRAGVYVRKRPSGYAKAASFER